MRRYIGTVVLVLLALSACGDVDTDKGGDSEAKPSSEQAKPEEEEAVIDTCAPNAATKWMEAVGTITNRTSKPSDYIVTVAFEGADGAQLATGTASAQNVQPDQRAAFTASAIKELAAGSTCRVVEVNRLAS